MTTEEATSLPGEYRIIILQTRSDDFHASIKNNPEYWGSGGTVDAAIGDLIRCHPEQFAIKLRWAK